MGIKAREVFSTKYKVRSTKYGNGRAFALMQLCHCGCPRLCNAQQMGVRALGTLRPSPFALRPSPFVLRPSPFALRPSPFTYSP
jgi:hypothetical protein